MPPPRRLGICLPLLLIPHHYYFHYSVRREVRDGPTEPQQMLRSRPEVMQVPFVVRCSRFRAEVSNAPRCALREPWKPSSVSASSLRGPRSCPDLFRQTALPRNRLRPIPMPSESVRLPRAIPN